MCLVLTFCVDRTVRNVTVFPSLARICGKAPSFQFTKSVSAVVVIPHMMVFTFMGSVDGPLLTDDTTLSSGGLATVGCAVNRDAAYVLYRLGASHGLRLALILLWLCQGV